MFDPRIPHKNPHVAAVLTYLVPGAGQIYQGRIFKGVLYLVCILSTLLCGLALSEWKAVYWRWEPGEKNIAFFAQGGIGLIALPALIQSRRYHHPDNQQAVPEGGLSAPYQGRAQIIDRNIDGFIFGEIMLKSVVGDFGPEVRGTFSGTLQQEEDGPLEPIKLSLGGQILIEEKVAVDHHRRLECPVFAVVDGEEREIGYLRGEIPRSFFNRFAVPLEDDDLKRLHGSLAKQFELAKVFTWIAGLLNLLAVWDALDGPAYGYGDEDEEGTDEKKPKKNASGPAAV